MTDNRDKNWRIFQTAVQQMLDNPRLLPAHLQIGQFNQTLHLWISPTFTPEKHWVFSEPQHQVNPRPKPRVQQIIWQQSADFQRLREFPDDVLSEPTFDIKTIEIDWDFYLKIREQLSKIHIPPFLDFDSSGRDGEQFGVQTLDLFYNARISWWSDVPDEWKPLADWYEEVIRAVG